MGIALRGEAKDAEALKLFEAAAEIDPGSVRVQVHLATAHQALGNWLLADEYLASALRQEEHPYIIRHRESLNAARRVIHSNIGRLEVEGQPAGAEVRLNGRLVGRLPLAEPVRATVGSYVLDVRLEGHYPSQRPIVLSGGALLREAVQLEPLPSEQGAASASGQLRGYSASGQDPRLEEAPSRRWLTWALVGASGAAAASSLGAFIFREIHAARWNDNSRCLEVERTRAEVCGGERDKVSTAEDVALVGGVLTGLFAAGAFVNAVAFDAGTPNQAGLDGCAVSWGGALCFGSF